MKFRFLITTFIFMYLKQGNIFAQAAHPLPFAISADKKLSENDILEKKEGYDEDVLPQVGYNDLEGIDFGLIGSLFYNGHKSDSLFYYEDFKYRLDFAIGGSYKSGQQGLLSGDNQVYLHFNSPFIARSKYNVSAELNLENDPDNLYYGIGSHTLHKSITYNGDPLYHYFNQQEKMMRVNVERMCLNGLFWPYVGLLYANENMNAVQNSLLIHDFKDHIVNGLGVTKTAALVTGLRFDTRNNKVNPSKGIVAEFTNEYDLKLNVNQGHYNKSFLHFNWYYSVGGLGDNAKENNIAHYKSKEVDSIPGYKQGRLRSKFVNKNVFAFRYAIGMINGNAPFYAYQNYLTSEDNIQVLGGDNNLRGYEQSRFTGRFIGFLNFEMRSSLLSVQKLSSFLTGDEAVTKISQTAGTTSATVKHGEKSTFYQFGLVPFADLGGVWDHFNDYFKQYNHYKLSGGMGARLAVNSDFVIRFDYAVSAENNLSVLSLSQTF